MSDLGGRHQHLAIEIGQHPFGTQLGTIYADDAKMFWTDLLYPGMKGAAGFLQELRSSGLGLFRRTMCNHGTVSGKRTWVSQVSVTRSPVIFSIFLHVKPHTRGRSSFQK